MAYLAFLLTSALVSILRFRDSVMGDEGCNVYRALFGMVNSSIVVSPISFVTNCGFIVAVIEDISI